MNDVHIKYSSCNWLISVHLRTTDISETKNQCVVASWKHPRAKVIINIPSISFSKKLAIFQHVTKAGCCPLSESTVAIESEISVAVSNESDEILNDISISSPSPPAEIAMSWVCHFSVVAP